MSQLYLSQKNYPRIYFFSWKDVAEKSDSFSCFMFLPKEIN